MKRSPFFEAATLAHSKRLKEDGGDDDDDKGDTPDVNDVAHASQDDVGGNGDLPQEGTLNAWPPDASAFFVSTFHTEIRDVQRQFAECLHRAIRDRTSLLGQLPTGSGKSLLALYACTIAQTCGETSEGGGRMYDKSAIVASSIDLQFQYLADASRFPDIGVAFVLLGKSNYACTSRIAKERETLVPFDGNEVAKAYFEDVCRECSALPPINAPIWTSSMKQTWMEHARARGVAADEADSFWARVAANDDCECRSTAWHAAQASRSNGVCFPTADRQSAKAGGVGLSDLLRFCQCPCARSRVLAKMADVIIINTAYVCTMAARDMLAGYLGKRFVIFDEAHLLPGDAQAIYDASATHSLHTKSLSRMLKKWKDVNAPLADRLDVDLGAFDRAFAIEDREALVWNCKDIVRELLTARVSFDEDAYKEVADWASAADQEIARHVVEDVSSLRSAVRASPKVGKMDDGEFDTVVDGVSASEGDADATRHSKAIETLKAYIFRHYTFESSNPEAQAFYRTVVATCSRLTPKRFLDELRRVRIAFLSLLAAKRACSQTAWRDDDHAARDQCPVAHKHGIRFEIDMASKARAIDAKLFGAIHSKPILMSATLTDENLCFDIFEALVGRKFATKEAFPSPFEKARRTFVVPERAIMPRSQKLYDPRATPEQKREAQDEMDAWRKKRMQIIKNKILENDKKMTLVIGPSFDDLHRVKEYMTKALSSLQHVDFGDKTRLRTFDASQHKGVLYGSKKLATGVNYPGQVGLVVILKSMNMALTVAELYAKQVLGQDVMPFYNWNRVNMFMQACGRLLRCPTDSGCVIFFNTEHSTMELSAIENVFGVAYETA